MNAVRKEDVFNEMEQLIESLSKEEKHAYAARMRKIKEDVEKLLTQQEDSLYYGVVNESLKEDWDNEKDDAYNEL